MARSGRDPWYRGDQAMKVEAIHLGAPRTPELWTVDSVRGRALGKAWDR
jgi:hypothetical protein